MLRGAASTGIHGATNRSIVEALQGDLPRLRGFGRSDPPRSGYEKPHLMAGLIGLLDELGLERVRLVGHDGGDFAGFPRVLRLAEAALS